MNSAIIELRLALQVRVYHASNSCASIFRWPRVKNALHYDRVSRRLTRKLGHLHLFALLHETRGKIGDLCRFARAVKSLDDDERASGHGGGGRASSKRQICLIEVLFP